MGAPLLNEETLGQDMDSAAATERPAARALKVVLRYPEDEDRQRQPEKVTSAPQGDCPSPWVGMALGVLGLVTWIIPILGLPVTIVGFVQAFQSFRKGGSPIAIVGLLLCLAGLAGSVANCMWGAYLGVTGQHRAVNQVMGNH